MFVNKEKRVSNIKIWKAEKQPVQELIPLCRKLAAEGSVMLKNDGVLPFKKGEKIAVFGRTQETYIKSGTGSGGLVRVQKQPCILDSLRNNGVFEIDESLVDIYQQWIKNNPYDYGKGWATEPWFQKEMPVSHVLAETMSKRNDAAVIIIGRTAGEDHDNSNSKGSYWLTDDEEEMIESVTRNFKRVMIVLNVGNLIELSFMDKYPVSGLMYIWQGGQEGAEALADILAGKVSPCGKMPDTQAMDISDYPSLEDFGNMKELYYNEDIYVGYRYFETFKPERIRYPFGFGLSYTTFDITYSAQYENGLVNVNVDVTNVGEYPAREVVQVYFGAPCGLLGTPLKQLSTFKKTKRLEPGESERLRLSFPIKQMAAYDDSGVTGNRFCYVLEAGKYMLYGGTDSHSAKEVLSFSLEETLVVERVEEAMAPEKAFLRFVAVEEDGRRILKNQMSPQRTTDLDERIEMRRMEEIPFAGDQGIKLIDVADGKHTMSEFVSQISDQDLCSLVCGEGMNSPKVTPGTGGAIGGVTEKLLDLGIPVCCVTDGPSGLRIGNDYKSTSLPNGYVFASSFDTELTEQIFELEGVELFAYDIDALLGPGMNIHRHPLCGRNFEYFSEDPLLSGKIAAAQSRGISKTGCSTTIKHFCCNNQELGRYDVNACVSERALREIYLKGFEIAIREGNATAIMTAYNSVNGYWTASNYDLTTTILRKEWGFKGFVMTDWWAKCNCHGEQGTKENLKAMVRAQNDVYMVCESAENKSHNLYEGLKERYISRSDLQRSAINLLNYIMHSPTFVKFVNRGCKHSMLATQDGSEMKVVAVYDNITSGTEIRCSFGGNTHSLFVFELLSNTDVLAQSPIIVQVDDRSCISLSIGGTEGKTKVVKRQILIENKEHILKFEFGSELQILKLTIKEA